MWDFEVKVRKPASLAGDAPVVIALVHNEEVLLPHFFRHYRALGFDRFVVFDDQSTDATADILAAQDNCLVLGAQARYGDQAGVQGNGRKLRFGTLLKMQLPAQLAPGGWALVVDADEFLVLPPGCSSIGQMVAMLEDAGQPCLTAPMVEFYPERLALRNYPAALDPFEACPYFDRGPYYDWAGKRVATQYNCGIRARLTRMLLQARPERARALFGDEAKYPSLNKVPLLKNGQGLERASNAHELTTPPPLGITACLAHFKFGPDLDARIEEALASQAYEADSLGYRFLREAIDALDDVSLVGEETVRYSGPRSLRDAGLM